MRFSFKQFEFDCERQILTGSGEVIALNDKALQLLALFISNPEKVHSKAEILDSVWTDRYVSDQVVFQNISQLRGLFGSEAIKTFPKKGYQWQLPVTGVIESNSDTTQIQHSHSSTASSETHLIKTQESEKQEDDKLKEIPQQQTFTAKALWASVRTNYSRLLLVLVLLVVLLATGINFFNQKPGDKPPVTQSLKTNQDAVFALSFDDNITFNKGFSISKREPNKKLFDSGLTSQRLFDSPYSNWQSYSDEKSDALLATRLYMLNDGVVLRFHLQGAERGWHDHIWAVDIASANHQLDELLSLLAKTQYLQTPSDHAALAELTLMLDKQPTTQLPHSEPSLEQKQLSQHLLSQHLLSQQLLSLQLLSLQLIKQHNKLKKLDIASALADQQLNKSPSEIHTGLLHLLRSDIKLQNRQWLAAEQDAALAIAAFQKLELPHLESRALIASAWVNLANREFRIGIEKLNQATSKARGSNEPLLEVDAMLTQSLFASKNGQKDMAYSLVDLAREMIDFHRLGEEHNVRVQNNLVWIADTSDEKRLHHQAIFEMSYSPQYEIYFYTAAEALRDHYIKSHNWNLAETTITSWQRPSFQALGKAHISHAKGDKSQAISEVKQAYQIAQTNYHTVDALDAALFGLQQLQNSRSNEQNQQVEKKEYQAFIEQNATRRWLDQNQEALKSLELAASKDI